MFLFDNVDETHNTYNIDCTYSSVSTVAHVSLHPYASYHKSRPFQLVLLYLYVPKSTRKGHVFLKKIVQITRNMQKNSGALDPAPAAGKAGSPGVPASFRSIYMSQSLIFVYFIVVS